MAILIKKVNISSFERLNNYYTEDKNTVYYRFDKLKKLKKLYNFYDNNL